MHTQHILLVAALLFLEACAIYGPEFKTSSPGFHRRPKLRDPNGFRLPGTARPTYYDLTLTLVLGAGDGTDNYFEGDVTITLDVDATNGKDTYDLQLNSEIPFTVNDSNIVWIKDQKKPKETLSCTINDIKADHIGIHCPKPINGKNQQVRIKYTQSFSAKDMEGAYIALYKENGEEKKMVATQFEQGYARRVMPCFDEPEYKAPIKLTLKTDTSKFDFSDWKANTRVKTPTKRDGNMAVTVFEDTPAMSTYLLAFVATRDFKDYKNSNSNADYDFSVFARSSAENYVSIAVENGPKLIDEMGKFTGKKYDQLGNKQITLVAVPEFQIGAMENWGLITFRETYLIDEGANRTTQNDLQYIVEVIAHELTHQWFGDYVTMDWWSDTFLNEGFAEYFEYYLTDKVFPDWGMMGQLVIKEQHGAFKADAYPDTIPLANNASDCTTEADFSNEFGDISYSKGASIIRMIRYAIKDEAFQKGLQTYIKDNKLSNPTPAILINAFQKALPKDTKIDLPTQLQSWIYKGGYPILDVSLDDKNIVKIRSTKFSSSLDKTGENNTSDWWIPLTYTTSDTAKFETIEFEWIAPENVSEFSIQLPDNTKSWIIFNLQSAGFFRVNYDEKLWNRIINVLNNSETYSTIHVLNRAQLLDDVFNIARSYGGEEKVLIANYLRAFKLAEYLKFETEYFPWFTFFTEIRYLYDRIQNEDTLKALKKIILETVSPQVKLPGKSDGKLSHSEVLKRNLLLSWACRVGHDGCIKWAQEQFESYKGDTKSIDNNYRDIIVCYGLANTNDKKTDYEFVEQLMEQSTLPLEGNDLARALTCFNDETWINQTLLNTVNYENPHFSRMLYSTILTGLISDGPEKRTSALKFVLDYDDSIEKYWQRIDSPEGALKKIANKIYSNDQIEIIQRYIDTQNSHPDPHTSMINAAKESIETIKTNLKWIEKFGNVLTTVIVYDGGDIPDPEPPHHDSATIIKINGLFAVVLPVLMKVLLS